MSLADYFPPGLIPRVAPPLDGDDTALRRDHAPAVLPSNQIVTEDHFPLGTIPPGSYLSEDENMALRLDHAPAACRYCRHLSIGRSIVDGTTIQKSCDMVNGNAPNAHMITMLVMWMAENGRCDFSDLFINLPPDQSSAA